MQSLTQITTDLLTNLEEKFLPKRRVTEKGLNKKIKKGKVTIGAFTSAFHNG
jgi:hypothetical protein